MGLDNPRLRWTTPDGQLIPTGFELAQRAGQRKPSSLWSRNISGRRLKVSGRWRLSSGWNRNANGLSAWQSG